MNIVKSLILKLLGTALAIVGILMLYIAGHLLLMYAYTGGDEELAKLALQPQRNMGIFIVLLPALYCIWMPRLTFLKKLRTWAEASGLGIGLYIVSGFITSWIFSNLSIGALMAVNSVFFLAVLSVATGYTWRVMASSRKAD